MVENKKILLRSPIRQSHDLPVKKLPVSNTDVWIGRWPDVSLIYVCWYALARTNILSHCYESPDVEVGGALLGNVYRALGGNEENGRQTNFIEVNASIRAENKKPHKAQMEFTTESWANINRVRDRDFPNLQIIGWYHSHPGWGIFLSNKDLFIQNNYFNEDFQLALLIETHQNEGAFFLESIRQKGPFKSHIFCWNVNTVRDLSRTYESTFNNRDVVTNEELHIPVPKEEEIIPDPDIIISQDELLGLNFVEAKDNDETQLLIEDPKKGIHFSKNVIPYLLGVLTIPLFFILINVGKTLIILNSIELPLTYFFYLKSMLIVLALILWAIFSYLYFRR